MSNRSKLDCDILVIGAGPAGIAATVSAAEAGARVVLVDDNPLPGGQIWRAALGESKQNVWQNGHAVSWLQRLRNCGATQLYATRVVARMSDGVVLAEDESDAIEIKFRSVILATGARELLLPFPGWTLPNVFAPGGLQALVKSGFSVVGKRVVIAGTGPLLFAVASFLQSKGAKIEGVFDQAPLQRMVRFAISLFRRPSMITAAIRYRASFAGSPLHFGWWPVSADGADRIRSITMTNGSRTKNIECDMLACGFHLIPNTELQAAFGCKIQDGRTTVDELQQSSVEGVFSVGESTGIGGLDLALIEGEIAGLAAVGKEADARKLFQERAALNKLARAMDQAFALRTKLRHLVREDTIVCRCEDVRWSSLRPQQSMRSARLHTRCGMGPCQGRICGPALHFLAGWENSATRPPIFPVRLSTLIQEPQASDETNN